MAKQFISLPSHFLLYSYMVEVLYIRVVGVLVSAHCSVHCADTNNVQLYVQLYVQPDRRIYAQQHGKHECDEPNTLPAV